MLDYAVKPIQGDESYNWMYDNNSLSQETFNQGIRKALDDEDVSTLENTVRGWVEKRKGE